METAHRLGVRGNAGLPGRLIETASAYGLSIRKGKGNAYELRHPAAQNLLLPGMQDVRITAWRS